MLKIVIPDKRRKNLSEEIVRQITAAIESGELRKGDALPSERMLSESLGISRGTIHNAYCMLKEKNAIGSKQGSHHFVIGMDHAFAFKHDQGVVYTKQYIENLLKLDFSLEEIQSMIDLEILKRQNSGNLIKIGVVECRPAGLHVFLQQLHKMNLYNISSYLLDEIKANSELAKDAMTCDVVFTTGDHYFDLQKNIPELEEKLVEVVTSWSEQTIFEMARIPSDANIGLVYSTPSIIDLVKSTLSYFNIKYHTLTAFNEKNLRAFKEFCKKCSVLIAEPVSIIFQEGRYDELLGDFLSTGGQIVTYKNTIDRGSLMIMEQALLRIMEEKGIKTDEIQRDISAIGNIPN